MTLTDTEFAELYDETRRESVEFPPFMANHLPMAVLALQRMGCSRARLLAYPAIYRAKGETALPDVPQAVRGSITAQNWQDHLGDRSYEGNYREFFFSEANRLGLDQVIATYLGTLLPGIAGSALHALMRLAYAKMANSTQEVGIALGYWAMVYMPLGDYTGAGDTEDPIEVLVRMQQMPDLHGMGPMPNDLLWEWMAAATSKLCFAPIASWLIVTDDTFSRLRKAALNLMATTMSFEALHAITALHQLRTLDLSREDSALALRAYWTAIAAVYPKIGFPVPLDAAAIEKMRNLPCPDWDEIRAKAFVSTDHNAREVHEHDISFVFSTGEEFALTGDRLYQVLAARRVGLI